MGILYGFYCEKHRESFDAGKLYYLSNFSSNVPDDVLQQIKTHFDKQNQNSDDEIKQYNNRLYILIEAFLLRHKGCDLKVWNDLEKKYWPLMDFLNDINSEWIEFSIWQDSLKPNIDNERLLSRYQDILNDVNIELKEITNELEYKKIQWLKRRKLNKKLEKKKNQKVFLEKEMKSKEIIEFFRDVLEQIQTEPIRNFKE